MRRLHFLIICLIISLIPCLIFAGWDWPAGPGTSMTKVATVDNDNTARGSTGQKIVYNPDNDRVQLIYIPDLVTYPDSRLMYAFSEDDGESFTTLGPIDNGNYAKFTALATDANDVPYIAWCEISGPPEAADPTQTVAIYFAKDVEFGAGLFESKLVSDPTQVNFVDWGVPNIIVSPDGQNIIIAWHANKPADKLQPYGIQIVRSTDGGETFSAPVEVVTPAELPGTDPTLSCVESPAMVLGESGYVFMLLSYLADATAQVDKEPAFIESFDMGVSWSTPAAIPLNPAAPYGHSWYQMYGPPILVNGEPHFVFICKEQSSHAAGETGTWHFRRDGSSWVSTKVSPPYDTEDQFFEQSSFASIAKDADNNIYVCYLTTSIAPGYFWGVTGLHISSDNGASWNDYPLPLHDYVVDQGTEFRSAEPNIAQNVGPDKLHVLAMQGGYWSGTPQAVWVFHADPSEIAGYEPPPKQDFPPITDEFYTFDDKVPFVWDEINQKGTAIDRAAWDPDPDDGSVGPIDMGINFEFYGQSFNNCYISPNGQISFTDPMILVAPPEGGATIPGIGYDNLFCVFAGDLNNGAYPDPPYSSKSGTVYYFSDPAAGKFIVEWENLNNHAYVENNLCVDTTITFQAVFDAFNKCVTFNYKDVGIGDYGKGTVIGVQPLKDDTLGVQYYGGGFPRDGYPDNESAVKIYKRGSRLVDQYYDYDDTIPFQWTEINTIGTALLREQFSASWGSPDTDDGSAGPIYMGMSFNFYDQTFDSINIGVNGQCSFTDPIDWITTAGYGLTIPGMGWDNILCPLAADIMAAEAYPNAPYNTATGTIYYYHDAAANLFIIEYEKLTNHHYVVNNACVDTTVTFQVILDGNDGSIYFYYKDQGLADHVAAERATIGIQPSKDGTLGVQYYGGNVPEGGFPTDEMGIKFFRRTGTSVELDQAAQPLAYKLRQNFPNPFNPTTTIQFSLKDHGFVSLQIFNILGQEVRTLISENMEAGLHQIQWDGRNDSNIRVPSGIYFYKLKAKDAYSQTRKMLLLK